MKRFLPLLFLTLLPAFSSAQGRDWLPLTISVFNESTAIPYTRFLATPIHPGIQVGVSRQWNSSTKNYLYQTANISYFYHKNLYQASTLSTELGYDYRFPFGLNLKALIGVGYMLAMNTQEVYHFEEGQYRSSCNSMMSKFIATLSIGAGYRINRHNEGSPEIFVLYQGGVIYPFSADFAPLMTQANLHIGVKIPIRIKDNK